MISKLIAYLRDRNCGNCKHKLNHTSGFVDLCHCGKLEIPQTFCFTFSIKDWCKSWEITKTSSEIKNS